MDLTTHRQYVVVQDNSKFLNTRSVGLKPFIDRIDTDRVNSGYKPYGAVEIARCMSHIATDDLEYFYKTLCQAKNFGSLWHFYCKPKKGSAVQPFNNLKNQP